MMKTFSQPTLYRLTLLWAFAESGLGGVLHGLKIPVTGFVLGAFSVVIISLMASFASQPYRDILKATLLVLAIKFAVSPHSPVPAYVAVLFQGVAGACMFQLFKFRMATVLIFSVLVLVESALQKPLVATLIFGNELWQAIDALANQLLVFFGANETLHFSATFLWVYAGVYACWGVLVGIWTYHLPRQLSELSMEQNNNVLAMRVLPRRKNKWMYSALALTILAAVLVYVLKLPAPLLYLGRTAALLLLMYGVLGPLVRWWMKKNSRNKQTVIAEFELELPRLSAYANQAWSLAAAEHKGLYRCPAFVRYLLYLTLTTDEQR
jgi:hypothetical protein